VLELVRIAGCISQSSFTIVDVAGDDDFGDRVEAASAGRDEAYKLDRDRDWRSEASSLSAAEWICWAWIVFLKMLMATRCRVIMLPVA
jgi:hypothetical protein